ncbi:hypothetical protein niasHT_001115 [Heterodera trifolii]|uniref:Uncharacterized protein n=1 Tax=Heterodera trifolii TaxID=157864 RepID=A0ABD2M048_9BILA
MRWPTVPKWAVSAGKSNPPPAIGGYRHPTRRTADGEMGGGCCCVTEKNEPHFCVALKCPIPVKENETASIEQFNAIATQILEDLNKIQDLQKRALKKIDETPPPQLPGFFTKTRKAIGAFLLRKIGVATTPSDDSNWEEYVKNAKKKVAESIDDCEVFKTIVKQFIVMYPALDQAGKDYLYKELIEVKQKQEKTLKRIELSDQITEALKKA